MSNNPSNASLSAIGVKTTGKEYWNLTPEELVEETITRGLGTLSDMGAILIKTGKFTGRSPKDRFIVEDSITRDSVDWNEINKPIDSTHFDGLLTKMQAYVADKDLFIRDAYACADANYRLNIRVTTEYPWSNQFAHNMFLRPSQDELSTFNPEWNILCAPGFHADPEVDGTVDTNFAIINFSKKTILIGGTAYTGEIKKGIFSVLNFILPHDHNVLSMHCSANVGKDGDTAVFFGLSGTGKTTLSADPNRALIGDDEHGWSDNSVFNFEGGCYAKTIDLSAEKEPEIYAAIKHGAILENIPYFENTRTPDFHDSSITQNTRVSYPIYHIANRQPSSQAGIPDHIFFLTADAFGVLPPISKLTPGQAMYQFISGYTAKVAGTELGVKEPKPAFSACFGAPFLPLHPTQYAEMLGKKMGEHKTSIWLVNTGWSGGPYGVGSRIKLKFTRAMITAAMLGQLNHDDYKTHDVFGLHYPLHCPEVPSIVMDPKGAWDDPDAYDAKAQTLAKFFVENFEQYADRASDEILAAAPKVETAV